MTKRLTANELSKVTVLEKVELAARRAVAIRYPDGAPDGSLMREFADQLAKIINDMGEL